MENKKVLYAILAVVIVAGVAIMMFRSSRSGPAMQNKADDQNQASSKNAPPKPTGEPSKPAADYKPVPQTAVPETKLPDRFPSDVPIEAGAQITQNFNAVNSSGKFQASREFISKKTVEENYTLYQAVLKQNGWTVTSTTTSSVQSIILATKGADSLNIRIYSSNNIVKVSINNETAP